MKITLLALFFSFSIFSFSQQTNRVDIKGRVVVESNDVEGITVFNSSSNKGTTTNDKGEFTIAVTLNDNLEFAALQFKDFSIIIDDTILKTQQLTVYLVEQVNKLDEVLILPYNLSGNLETDIASVRTFNPDMDALYFGIKNSSEYNFADDNRSKVENEAMHSQSQPPFRYGLNVINVMKLIISPLLHSEGSLEKKSDIIEKEQDSQNLKDYYSIAFVSLNFDIPKEKVDDFITYVEENGLDKDLMSEGRELELLQFLYSKRDDFLKLHETKD